MKLRNKITGEIVDNVLEAAGRLKNGKDTFTLAELCEEWEDYEEPKGYWFLGTAGCVFQGYSDDEWVNKGREEIGNYFKTEEEAERAVEKLKAWKRLKDLGFKCSYHSNGYHRGTFTADFIFDEDKLPIMDTFVAKDLDLLFGGEK